MNRRLWVAILISATVTAANAQVASHASTAAQPKPAAAKTAVVDRPVVRINGAVLTDRDLLREMFTIFPYARQHGGSFPKTMEADIRRGALEMIIFEELVYQEAERRHLSVSPARLDAALARVRGQFSPADYQRYLNEECKGSPAVLRKKVRRSLLIDDLLTAEIEKNATVTTAAVKAYYDANSATYQHPETFSIQTISIIPPANAGADAQKQARARAEEALRQAKRTTSYREFGLLAEKLSDDDWHVNMGDRKTVVATALPPDITCAARAMKPGQVSDLIQLGPNYTLFRLNAHTPAGRRPFEEIKADLQSQLQKTKVNQLRSSLNERLHKNAKIELLATGGRG